MRNRQFLCGFCCPNRPQISAWTAVLLRLIRADG